MSGAKSPHAGLTRRSFLKTTGVVAGSTALVGAGIPALQALAEDDGETSGETKVCYGHCRSNCAENCRYAAYVTDGKLLKLEPADYPVEGYTGCCLKGLSYIERIYSPTRIKYPMRRAGERGEGKWERISWEDALEEIATKWKGYIEEYGSKSIVIDTQSGNWGQVNGIFASMGLEYNLGVSFLESGYDQACGHGINRMLGTGDWMYTSEPRNMLDASMIVVWGTNPVFTSPQKWRWIRWAQERGAKVVAIDPIKSATAHKADQYIPVNPGHDGYLALAMSNYIVENGLLDEDFMLSQSDAAYLVRRDTKKYLRKSDYVEVPVDPATEMPIDDFYVWDGETGDIALASEAKNPTLEGSFTTKDGIQVDTAFSLVKEQLKRYSMDEASRLCGISQEDILAFTEEFASQDAVSVYITYGLDHYVNGYQTTWAVCTLMALTGNLAKKGAGFHGIFLPYSFSMPNFVGMYMTSDEYKDPTPIPSVMLHEVCSTQEFMGEKLVVKSMISHSANSMSNFGGQRNFFEEILPALDLWVVIDMELNDSARYADVVLPCASWYEVDDFSMVQMAHPYALLAEKAIDPVYESRPDGEIFADLGRKMGLVKTFHDDYGFEFLGQAAFDSDLSKSLGLTFDRLKEEKVLKCVSTSDNEAFIRGLTVPFPTQTGKIEFYCEDPQPRLMNGRDLSDRVDNEHVVYYQPPHEAGQDSELADKYPLVFLQEHSRFRVHSQWFNVPMLREIDPEPLAKVSGIDAEARGVKTDDVVEVFNDRGHAVLKCLIDESIAPGVISIPKGWQRDQYIEGCFQEMTTPEWDPYPSTWSFYDSRVDFRKWEG